MPKHRLIIVDGITGLGKSTTTEFIHRQIERNGLEAKGFSEGHRTHSKK